MCSAAPCCSPQFGSLVALLLAGADASLLTPPPEPPAEQAAAAGQPPSPSEGGDASDSASEAREGSDSEDHEGGNEEPAATSKPAPERFYLQKMKRAVRQVRVAFAPRCYGQCRCIIAVRLTVARSIECLASLRSSPHTF